MKSTGNFEIMITISLLITTLGGTLLFAASGQSTYTSNQQLSKNQGNIIKDKITTTSANQGISKHIIEPKPSQNSSSSQLITNNVSNGYNSYKAVIINFDDGSKDQFTYAKPILDKYGFKATFFIVCNYANSGKNHYMNWQDISQLYNDKQDIDAHTMNHKNLTELASSAIDLNYEVGQSKQCLIDHGVKNDQRISEFAYPYHRGVNDPTIVKTVAKYYDIARTGGKPLQFLNVPTDRYSIAGISVAAATKTKNPFANDDSQKLDNFINLVNSQNKYNKNGQVNAIPIIVYHEINYKNSVKSTTTPDLFAAEMKYLHDNSFKVLTMANLRYNQNTNSLYLGDIPGITAGA